MNNGIIETTRAALGDREFADHWAEGESLTLEQVSAEPLETASVRAEKRAEQAPVPTAAHCPLQAIALTTQSTHLTVPVHALAAREGVRYRQREGA